MGVIQAGLGAGEVVAGTSLSAAGIASCLQTGGLSCLAIPAGGAVAIAGADNVRTGTGTIMAGQPQRTLGSLLVQEVTGLSPQASELVYGLVTGGAGVGASKALTHQAGKSVVKGGLKEVNPLMEAEANFAGRGVVRNDLAKHLVEPEVFSKSISGGHSLQAFEVTLKNSGGKLISKIETSPGSGIYKIRYELPSSKKEGVKTVFDSLKYPNMVKDANHAANKALIQYQVDGLKDQHIVVNGIEFSAPIQLRNGVPYVPTVYPTGLAK